MFKLWRREKSQQCWESKNMFRSLTVRISPEVVFGKYVTYFKERNNAL